MFHIRAIQDYLQYRQYTYDRLDGSLRAEERFAAVRSFSSAKAASSSAGTQASAGPFVFLITTRAGGVGLNLVAADTVSLFKFFIQVFEAASPGMGCSWQFITSVLHLNYCASSTVVPI